MKPLVFGVGTADHQCEAHDPAREDVWDQWEREQGLTPRGRATDFWNRFQEDIDLARGLGCGLFRFSVAWARVEPAPGQFDEAALRHYAEVAAAIRAAGMEPMVTLHHYTWPPHLEKSGGMTGSDFPQLFARYAAKVAEAMGSSVGYWVTFNEPTMLVYGYTKPWWKKAYRMPPGMPAGASAREQTDAITRLIPNLFRAHALARAEIRQRNPEAMVGTNPFMLGLPAWLRFLLDWAATRWHTPEDLHRHVRRLSQRPAAADRGGWIESLLRHWTVMVTSLNTNWWHLGQAGRLPELVCPRECVGQQDYVGFDYYWGVSTVGLNRLYELSEAAAGVFDQAPVWPGALYSMMRYLHRLFPGQPQLLIENGCVVNADGIDRDTYLRRHLAEVARARRRGVNLVGYVCWAITTNREWGLSLGPGNDFGLYRIDLDGDPDLVRQPTPSVDVYRELISSHPG